MLWIDKQNIEALANFASTTEDKELDAQNPELFKLTDSRKVISSVFPGITIARFPGDVFGIQFSDPSDTVKDEFVRKYSRHVEMSQTASKVTKKQLKEDLETERKRKTEAVNNLVSQGFTERQAIDFVSTGDVTILTKVLKEERKKK